MSKQWKWGTIYFLGALFTGGIIFHLLILSGILPYDFVWGGRLKTHEEMIGFEMFSLVSNLLFLLVVLIKGEAMGTNSYPKTITMALWIMGGLFALNTIGNIVSLSLMETLIFTPLTLLTAILCIMLAKDKTEHPKTPL